MVRVDGSTQILKPAPGGLIGNSALTWLNRGLPVVFIRRAGGPVHEVAAQALSLLTVLSPKKQLRSRSRMNSRSCCAQARRSFLSLGRLDISQDVRTSAMARTP